MTNDKRTNGHTDKERINRTTHGNTSEKTGDRSKISEGQHKKQIEKQKPDQETKKQKKQNENRKNSLKVLTCNVRGLKSKLNSIQNILKSIRPEIVCLTETNVNEDEVPHIDEYIPITKERVGKKGSQMILVNNKIKHEVKEIKSAGSVAEVQWIRVKLKEGKVTIGNFYGPQENLTRAEVQKIYDELEKDIEREKRHGAVIITGDFNAKLNITKGGKTIQKCSSNGKILNRMIENVELVNCNYKSNTGTWTRQNRKKASEKSVIDYVLTTAEHHEKITSLEIDEGGTLRIKGEEESDHNTFTFEVEGTYQRQVDNHNQRSQINFKEPKLWTDVNESIKECPQVKADDKINEHLDRLKKIIRDKNKKYITKRTEKRTIREARKNMKKSRRTFNEICKMGSDETQKVEYLEKYKCAQKSLRKIVEEDEAKRLNKIMTKISLENETQGKTLWEIVKKRKRKNKMDHDLVTEDDKIIEEPEEAKEYIANYYENLYKAREELLGFEEETKEIKKTVEEKRANCSKHPMKNKIQISELDVVVKELKKGKAMGPDKIPNEFFINANAKTKQYVLDIINQVHEKQHIPEEWKKGIITTIYKNKGKKGKCSNERGITVSSNFGKIYERIVNNRLHQTLEISPAQAGGKKGKSTVDHIMLVDEAIANSRKLKKEAYIVFLDVTKAYDKAWLEAIMYVLAKRNVDNETWESIFNLNTNLRAKIKTKYGETRDIHIVDSIRQGGVLSVAMYATLMDEIATEIKTKDVGIPVAGNQKMGCLLWMDDVVLMANSKNEMETMLQTTYEIASKYRIVFGQEKSKLLKFGNTNNEDMVLGNMVIEETQKYKYLGMTINSQHDYRDQITETKGKVEGALKNLELTLSDEVIQRTTMKTRWTLFAANIIPIIMHGMESFRGKQTEASQLQTIANKAIKRILKVPNGTPNIPMMIETGNVEIVHQIHIKQLNNHTRINELDNEDYTKVMYCESPWWQKHIQEIKTKYGIVNQDMDGKSKRWKKEYSKNKVYSLIKEKQKTGNQRMSKVQYYFSNKKEWRVGERAKYQNKLTRRDAEIILRARTKMLSIKGNFGKSESTPTCRVCLIRKETQEHILENCIGYLIKNVTPITTDEIFEEDTNKLRKVAANIRNRIEILEQNEENNLLGRNNSDENDERTDDEDEQ